MALEIALHKSILGLDRSQWLGIEDPDFPFSDYDFLEQLEISGSLGERTGWYPLYLVAHRGEVLLGAMLLYLKTNSYGEYIFDWQWAHAYESRGVAYYPKLLSAVPFTPATGPKILVAADGSRSEVVSALLKAFDQVYANSEVSSAHGLFLPKSSLNAYREAGFYLRHSYQYHWHNRGYSSFQDFLGSLKGKRRRQIERERQSLQNLDLEIMLATGEDLNSELAEASYSFYSQTTSEKQALPYLTKEFFIGAMAKMPERTMFCYGKLGGRIVAGSLFFLKGAHLYGRYWGAIEDIRNLHFELCYYRPMEFAIAQKLARFEAGAQGPHKIFRGFLPSLTYSAHKFKEPQFAAAIHNFIDQEKAELSCIVEEETQRSPYR